MKSQLTQCNGGTNVQYHAGERAARANVAANDLLTVTCIRNAVRTLKRANAPKIDGKYVSIIHTDVAHDLMSDNEWKNWHQYVTPENMYTNEIGEIAGVRFVETTEAKIFADAGASSTDVYSTLVLGKDAYGTTSIEGGGLEMIVKQKGSAGTADPLDQRATIGWKATKVAERLVEDYMVRIETGCSYNA